jgi:hypothetical protein
MQDGKARQMGKFSICEIFNEKRTGGYFLIARREGTLMRGPEGAGGVTGKIIQEGCRNDP